MIRTFHIEVLRVSNLRFAFSGVHHIGPFNSVVVRVNPENVFRFGIKINSLYSLLVVYHVHLFPSVQVVGSEFGSVGEQHDNVIIFSATHTTVSVRQLETLPARAGVRAVQVRADVRAVMITGLAFVDVHAVLPVILRDYVTGIAGADVAAVNEIVALVRATAAIITRTVVAVI